MRPLAVTISAVPGWAVLQPQGAAELTQKGLPYWLFFFLFSVILLLLAVIFLRDKGLRLRMSLFFSGARRRMLQIRLQARLKKEREKKAALWAELGRKAWSENVRAACIEADCVKLAALEEEMHLQQMTWHEVFSRIETLARQHEESARKFQDLAREQEDLRKPHEDMRRALLDRQAEVLAALKGASSDIAAAESGIRAVDKGVRAVEENGRMSEAEKGARLDKAKSDAAAFTAQVKALESRLPRLEDERAALEKEIAAADVRIREFDGRIRQIRDEQDKLKHATDKETRDWQKSKERVQDRIVEIKRLMEPLFQSMGRALDEHRPADNDLGIVYFQIDTVNRTIEEIEARIAHLRPGA